MPFTHCPLSDVMNGTTFELDSRNDRGAFEEEVDNMFWNEANEDLPAHENPCTTTFKEWKSEMTEVLPGVWKKIAKPAAENTKGIDLARTRVTYHRNLYVEGEDHPFDSTYLNNKKDEICLPLKSVGYVDGLLEAVETMKEGERSYFIIGWKKMFGALGCPPRVRIHQL